MIFGSYGYHELRTNSHIVNGYSTGVLVLW